MKDTDVPPALIGSPMQQRVYRVLREKGRQVKRSEIADELEKSANSVSQALRGLQQNNLAKQMGGGFYRLTKQEVSKKEERNSKSAGGGTSLQVVPTISFEGSGMEVIDENLQLPGEWIRETYSVEPTQVCALRVGGNAMAPTLKPGQRVYAIRHDNIKLRNGEIYALANGAGCGLKRIEVTHIDDAAAIVVRTDNDDFSDYWQRPDAFHADHDVLARLFLKGEAL
jgi:hypothetical protein